MSPAALALVLFAALLHASWNALVKAASDRAITLAAVACTHAATGLVLILASAPPAPASWAAIAASTVLHYAYYLLLFQAYRLGDLSQVYPISRGMAPALVAFGAFLLIGESLSAGEWAGLGLVTAGIGVLAQQAHAGDADRRAIVVAAVLGLSIAAYSVSDGIGVRASGSPLGYMGWLFLLESPVVIAILLTRRLNGAGVDWRVFRLGLVGGLFAVTAYGIVLFANTLAPISAVSAVRESSVVIAALIGVVVFGERPWRGRLVAAVIVATGVVLLALSG